jgi:hypothetical protein
MGVEPGGPYYVRSHYVLAVPSAHMGLPLLANFFSGAAFVDRARALPFSSMNSTDPNAGIAVELSKSSSWSQMDGMPFRRRSRIRVTLEPHSLCNWRSQLIFRESPCNVRNLSRNESPLEK